MEKAKIQLFSEYAHKIKIKGNGTCINMVAKYFAHRPPPWPWSTGKNSTFAENRHVACQIKGNDECSNMQAHILSLHATSTHGMGSKHYFSESSHVHMK